MKLTHKIKTFRENKIEYFYAISLLVIYSIWKIIKTYIGPNVESLNNFGTYVNESLASLYVKFMALILTMFSIDHTSFITQTSYGEFITLAISGAAGIYVAYHCLGITASLVYALTLFLLPGSLKRKMFFAIIGLVTMFFANALRLISLVFLDKYASRFWVELNHSVIFVIMFYSLLLIFHFLYLKPYILKKK